MINFYFFHFKTKIIQQWIKHLLTLRSTLHPFTNMHAVQSARQILYMACNEHFCRVDQQYSFYSCICSRVTVYTGSWLQTRDLNYMYQSLFCNNWWCPWVRSQSSGLTICSELGTLSNGIGRGSHTLHHPESRSQQKLCIAIRGQYSAHLLNPLGLRN